MVSYIYIYLKRDNLMYLYNKIILLHIYIYITYTKTVQKFSGMRKKSTVELICTFLKISKSLSISLLKTLISSDSAFSLLRPIPHFSSPLSFIRKFLDLPYLICRRRRRERGIFVQASRSLSFSLALSLAVVPNL